MGTIEAIEFVRQESYEQRYKKSAIFVDFLFNVDLDSIHTPFLRAVVTEFRSDDTESAKKITKEKNPQLFQFGRSVGLALRASNQVQGDNYLSSSKFLLNPVNLDGKSTSSMDLFIFSQVLGGLSNDHIIYQAGFRKGREISSTFLTQLREEVSLVIPRIVDMDTHKNSISFPRNVYTAEQLLQAGRVCDEDTFSYLDLNAVTSEDLSPFEDALKAALDNQIASYGGINSDVLLPAAQKHLAGVDIYEKAEVCADKDEALGLRMPQAWYFNPVWPSMATGVFYNAVQARPYLSSSDRNKNFRKSYGIVGLIEMYGVEDLVSYAADNSLQIFSTPYDLILTAHYLAHKTGPSHLIEKVAFQNFAQGVVDYSAKHRGISAVDLSEYLNKLNDESRLFEIIHMLRDFWQNKLLPAGVTSGDEEIILYDQNYYSKPTAELAINRKPNAIFMGGNIDNYYFMQIDPVIVVSRNLKLARTQYGENANVIIPQYKDIDSNDRWFFHMSPSKSSNDTATDVLILHLLSLRELGKHQLYHDLRVRYEELCER